MAPETHNYQPELDHIHREIKDIKALMSSMVEAMARITVIEERQHAYSSTAEKVLDRLDEVVKAQHKTELYNATNAGLAGRVEALETVVRETHLENKTNKARFETMVFMVRAIWAVIGLVGAGGLGYFFTMLSQHS